ncbi:MAG: BREX-1 system adenine-specific DNA-methyltransferase PglX, partial [Bacillota bacterium]
DLKFWQERLACLENEQPNRLSPGEYLAPDEEPALWKPEVIKLKIDFEAVSQRDLFDRAVIEAMKELLPQVVKQSEIMSLKYDTVITNPPYMGSNGINPWLSEYIKESFPDSKSDLCTVFMEQCLSFVNNRGYMGMINLPSWMFLSSFEALRKKILSRNTIISMVHFGRGVFGSDFGTTSFIITKSRIVNYIGIYRKLFLRQGAVDSVEQKRQWFLDGIGEYFFQQKGYLNIPGSPIAYWVSKRFIEIFAEAKPLSAIAIPKLGMRTGDNDRFLRIWHEIVFERMGKNLSSAENVLERCVKWVPYSKGGEYRKWYGNHEYVVNWENNGEEIKENTKIVYPYLGDNLGWKISGEQNYFQSGITWSRISSSFFGVRYTKNGYIFDTAGPSLFPSEEDLKYILGFLCTKLVFKFLGLLNPSLAFQVGDVAKLPLITLNNYILKLNIEKIVKVNIDISKADWDSFETSWDFEEHLLLRHRNGADIIQQAFANWQVFAQTQFEQLHHNEEELNRIFIEIYGLQDELTPEVEEKDITIRKADLERDIKSFFSYAVGCMMGRYSLDVKGLACAGGEFDSGKYQTFPADRDAIIPILSEEYFEDDIVSRFVAFVKIVFGEKTLSQNLNFIAAALGQTANESAIDRIRKYFVNDFYKDHVQSYKKRPVYWLFTSGRQKAFNALIYMHRYHKGMVAKVRTDYLHELQGKHEMERRRLEQVVAASGNQREKRAQEKRIYELAKQKEELRKYDELLRHVADQQIEIDLDDGVKINYAKFEGLLAKI